jgi:hypothetical protein
MAQEHQRLIADLRAALETTSDGPRRERLLALLHKLDKSHGTDAYHGNVRALIDEAEADAAEIAPFLSRLSSLLP